MLRLLLSMSFLGLSACSSFNRSSSSGYSDHGEFQESQAKQYYRSKQNHKLNKVKSELGLHNASAITESQQAQLNLRLRLRQMEDSLGTRQEKNQYYQLKPFFRSDSERIRFLSLPNMAIKKKYIQLKGMKSDSTDFDSVTIDAIERNDIILGMTKNAVKESWGDPNFIEVAGETMYGNERWGYLKYISTESGYNKEQRVIIFESGRVAGWERQKP